MYAFRLISVVEDVVSDGVAGQIDVLHDLAERLGAGLQVDHGQAFLPRRRRDGPLQSLQRVSRFRLVVDQAQDLAEGGLTRERESHRDHADAKQGHDRSGFLPGPSCVFSHVSILLVVERMSTGDHIETRSRPRCNPGAP
jgi:hypothetical protein